MLFPLASLLHYSNVGTTYLKPIDERPFKGQHGIKNGEGEEEMSVVGSLAETKSRLMARPTIHQVHKKSIDLAYSAHVQFVFDGYFSSVSKVLLELRADASSAAKVDG